MNRSVKMIVVLGVVSLLSGASLAFMYKYATPLIYANQKRALEEAIFNVIPNAARYESIERDSETFFEVYDSRNKMLGYAFIAEGNGYQGKIQIIAGIDTKLEKLKGIEVLESSETPGLGAEITNEPFKKQFRGLSALPQITFTKGKVTQNNEIQAITGATISTRSVVGILNKEITRIREVLLH